MNVQSFSNSKSIYDISEKCVNIMTLIDEATKGDNTQTEVSFENFNATEIFTTCFKNIQNRVLDSGEEKGIPWRMSFRTIPMQSSVCSIGFERLGGEYSKEKMKIIFNRLLEKLISNWNEARVENYPEMTIRITEKYILYIKENEKSLEDEFKLIHAMTLQLNLYYNDLVAYGSWNTDQPNERPRYIWLSISALNQVISKFDFRFNDIKIAKLFSMIVLLSDQYLQLKTPEDEGKDQNFHRFFKIAIQLPFELQTALANKSYGEHRNFFVRSSLLNKVLVEEFSKPIKEVLIAD